MEEIKATKKERKFLKAVGNIAKVLANELVMGIARKFIGKAIDKIGNKRQGLSMALIILASSFAIAQYPTTGNKQRLGFQTTGDGLVWRGSLSDTASIQPTNNQNAWVIIDTVNLKLYSFDFTSNVWNLVGGATSGLTMPFDSITFNTAKNGTVGIGEVEYNDTQGSLIQGLKGGLVTNVIGQQLHQRVNNRTGATLTKGTVVYLSGSQGNRITVAKGLAVSDAFSANTFGVVSESIADNASGFIITEGLITGLNTSALTEDSAVYLSPTVAGGLTSTKPQAPQHTVYIGICVKSNAGSGELFVKIRNGQELDELHDVRITSPVDKASLYYKLSEKLWRDTTATLFVSDTAAMLANYATKAYADTTGRLYARQDFTNVSTSTLTWTQTDTLISGGINVVQIYRNGQILLPTQYTIPTSTSIVIEASSFKVNDNYTVIFPRGGGAGSGGGSGSLTSISGGTGITVSPNPITTTGTVSADLSVLMELTDTTLLNLTTRFASKLNTTDTASLSNRIDGKGNGTVTSVATAYGLTGGTITTTGTLRVDSNTVYNYVRDSIVKVRIGNDTIKILKQEYNNVTSDTLIWTTTIKFPIQLRAYILLFRNGQLLINDQFSIIDTNKIKVAASSYKLGENYTLVTVSGIGSAGISQTGNPIYPEAGIAVSTGTTWTTSIPNNSTNWNTAYTDRLKWDGGATGLVASTGRTSLGGTTIGQYMFTLTNPSAISFPRFNADNTVTALTSTNYRTAIGAGTVTEVDVSATAGNPISISDKTTTPKIELLSATTSRNGYLSSTDWTTFNNKQAALNGTGFVKASGTTITYDNSTYLTTSSASTTYLAKTDTAAMLLPYFRDADTSTLNLTSRFASKLNISDTAAMLSNYNTRINNKLNISDTLSMLTPYFRDADTSLLNLTSRFNTKLNILDTAAMLLPYLKDADTTSLNLASRLATKLNISDTAAMLANYNSRINLKLNISDTAAMLIPYLRKLDTVSLSNRINLRVNISDTLNMLVPYLRKADTTLMLSKYLRRADTSLLNLSSRFATKVNISDTAAMLSNYNARINLKLNISDTTNMLVPYLRKADTTLMLSKYLRRADTTLLNLTSRFATKLNISDTAAMLANYNSRINTKLNISDTAAMLIPYYKDADTSLLNLNSRFATKLNILDTASMLSKYLRKADTSLLNLTSRFATKLNISDTSAMLFNYNSRINLKLNISDTTNMLVPYLKKVDTTNMLIPYLRDADTTNMLIPYLRKTDTTNMLLPYLKYADTTNMLLPYFKDTDTTLLNLTSRFAAKQNNITLTTTGTSGPSSFDGTTLNIPQYSSGSSGTVTSVGLSAPSIFTVGGSPVTTNGTLALTYSGTALPLANGGTGATTADAALTNFGATAMGKSLFGLTNTVTEKFIKVNTNNTITLLNAADTRAAIGATTRGSNNFTLPDIGSISFLRYNADNSITQLNATDFRTAISAVSSVTASSPLASTGGTTPNITIGEASATNDGIVSVQPQTFAGFKTFNGSISTPTITLNYSTARTTNAGLSTYTVQGNDNYIIFNRFGTVTLTLPNATTFSGRLIYLKTVQGNVISNSANVVPLIGGNPGQAILDATAGKWCTLLSDGTYWNIMQAN